MEDRYGFGRVVGGKEVDKMRVNRRDSPSLRVAGLFIFLAGRSSTPVVSGMQFITAQSLADMQVPDRHGGGFTGSILPYRSIGELCEKTRRGSV